MAYIWITNTGKVLSSEDTEYSDDSTQGAHEQMARKHLNLPYTLLPTKVYAKAFKRGWIRIEVSMMVLNIEILKDAILKLPKTAFYKIEDLIRTHKVTAVNLDLRSLSGRSASYSLKTINFMQTLDNWKRKITKIEENNTHKLLSRINKVLQG